MPYRVTPSTIQKRRNQFVIRCVTILVLCCIPYIALGVAPTVPTEIAALHQAIDGVLNQPGLASTWVGVRVETLDGEMLYDFNGNKLMMPASNQKLITAAAGLELLGPDYVWETRVWADAWEVTDGSSRTRLEEPLPAVLPGNLYLQGGGDPTLMQDDLLRMARQLYARGVREVRGDLIYDDTFFDDVLWAPGWGWDDFDYYYSAPVSGLAISPDRDYDANTIKISVYPANALFEQGRVVISPNLANVEIVNETRTAGSSAGPTIAARWDGDKLVVSGYTPLGKAASNVWFSVREPSAFVAGVFAGALEAAGIVVHGDVLPSRLQGEHWLVVSHSSMPLSQLIVPFLKLSNNGHGEVIVKSLGRKFRSQGTWSAGTATVEMFLKDIVRVNGTFNMADGSGLGRKNLVTPEQLVALLRYMAGRTNFSLYHHALPVAGASDRMTGGTLRSRMQGTPAQYNARAKTGTLSNVSALSGYVTSSSGETLVFSIMLNHAVGVSSTLYQDAIVNVLSRYRSPVEGSVAE